MMTNLASILRASLLLVIEVSFFVLACNQRSELCTYSDSALRIFNRMEETQRNLPLVTGRTDFAGIEQYVVASAESINDYLEEWRDLRPPSEAGLWHESVDMILAELAVHFQVMSLAARERNEGVISDLAGVLLVVGTEAGQLETQAQRLFESCE